jgi:hypothetical protein
MHVFVRLSLRDTVHHQRYADQTEYHDNSDEQPEPSSASWVVSEHGRLPRVCLCLQPSDDLAGLAFCAIMARQR